MPLTARSGEHSTPQFMFVNQDATSVLTNVDDRQLKQAKQSHVQRQRSAKKRFTQSESFPKPPPRSKVLRESVQGPPKEVVDGSLNEPQPTDSQLSAFSFIQSSTLAELRASGAKCDLPTFPANAQLSCRGRSDSTDISQHYLANDEVPRTQPCHAPDPFAITTLKLHPAAPSLFHYYTNSMVPRIFSLDARATKVSGSRHLYAFQKDMQWCMTDEAQMYALLASSLVHKNRFESHLSTPGLKARDETRALLYFKTQAMAAVRQSLANGILDPGLVQVVYRLMATERCLRNHEAARTHFKALLALVNALGGVQSLDSYNKERVIHSDLFEAAQWLKSPDLPLTWDPGDLPVETMYKIAQSGSSNASGSGFFGTQLSKIFHPDMLDIFSALTTVVELTVYSWTPNAELTTEDISWQTLRRAAIEHRLLSFPSTHNDAGDHNFIQECTRVATLFWMTMYLGNPVLSRVLAPFTSLLRQTLERSGLQSLWYPHSALLLWIVAMGAFIAQEGEEYDWFATLAAKVATYLQLKKVADVQKVLQGFFYIDDLQHKVLAELVGKFEQYLRQALTKVRYYDLHTSPQEPFLCSEQAIS